MLFQGFYDGFIRKCQELNSSTKTIGTHVCDLNSEHMYNYLHIIIMYILMLIFLLYKYSTGIQCTAV